MIQIIFVNVNGLGGKINVETEESEGTLFIIQIPI